MTKKIIKPESVFQQYAWLEERNVPMITHNDLDGLITAVILHHVLDWELIGMYDFENIWTFKNYNGSIKDPVYVDLDIAQKGIRSIGHHMIEESTNSINPNHLFGLTTENYTEKYPLSTSFFLLWLFEIPFPENKTAQFLLLHGDSIWKNYQKYQQNVEDWLFHLGFYEALGLLLEEENHSIIKNKLLPLLIGWNKQCSYNVINGNFQFKESREDGKNVSVQSLVDAIVKAFNFKPLILPSDLKKRFSVSRTTIDLQGESLMKTLIDFCTDNYILSYSLKYKNIVDISYIGKDK